MAMFGYMTDINTVEETETQEIVAEGGEVTLIVPLSLSPPQPPPHHHPLAPSTLLLSNYA